MAQTRLSIRRRTVAPGVSAERGDERVRIVVIDEDTQPAADALRRFAAKHAARAPHYYIAADGAVTRLVPEERATRYLGRAAWQGEARPIDPFAVVVVLEHSPGAPFGAAQLDHAHILTEQIAARHDLSIDDLYLWDDIAHGPDADGALALYALPPDEAAVLGDVAGPDYPAERYETPFDPNAPAVLDGDDGRAAQTLWEALQQATFGLRADGYHADRPWHLRADADQIGAPLGPPAAPGQVIADGGKQYAFQVFAGETLAWDAANPQDIRRLSDILGGKLPGGGLGLALLQATFAAGGAQLVTTQASPPVIVAQRLGAPLGKSYRWWNGSEQYAIHVLARDTIYTPIYDAPKPTNWGDIRRLSQAPAGPLAEGLTAETYKAGGASYDAAAPFAQAARAAGLGAPLGPPTTLIVDGTSYDVQVFALDTLYATPGAPPKRKSALAHDPALRSAQPVQLPQPPPPHPPSVIAGILPPSGLSSVWLEQHPNAPDPVRRLIAQALCLLGYENTIFDALPPNLRAMTWGGAPANQTPGGKYYKDICCADYVTLVLAAAGLDYHWTGADGTNNTRRANYYNPCPGNAARLRQVGDGEPRLPGDIIVYGSAGNGSAYHVNLYIGDLRGALTLWRDGSLVQQAYQPGDGYTLLEGSINDVKPNIGYNMRPANPNWYSGSWSKRGRLLELEQAYRQAGLL